MARMAESKKRDNARMAATLDIVSRSFNRRRDGPMIFAIVPQRFFGDAQLIFYLISKESLLETRAILAENFLNIFQSCSLALIFPLDNTAFLSYTKRRCIIFLISFAVSCRKQNDCTHLTPQITKRRQTIENTIWKFYVLLWNLCDIMEAHCRLIITNIFVMNHLLNYETKR